MWLAAASAAWSPEGSSRHIPVANGRSWPRAWPTLQNATQSQMNASAPSSTAGALARCLPIMQHRRHAIRRPPASLADWWCTANPAHTGMYHGPGHTRRQLDPPWPAGATLALFALAPAGIAGGATKATSAWAGSQALHWQVWTGVPRSTAGASSVDAATAGLLGGINHPAEGSVTSEIAADVC